MKALWHAIYWSMFVLICLSAIAGGLARFIKDVAEAAANHAEKKLRAHRVRA